MAEPNTPPESEPEAPVTDQPQPEVTSTPSVTSEDELLKSAGEGLQDEEAAPVAPQPVRKKKSRKKLVIALLVVLLLAGGGVGAWFLLSKDKTTDSSSNEATQTETKEVKQTYEPDSVAYAFRTASSEPYGIFLRPAAGGDRTEVQKLDRDEEVVFKDVVGQTIVFASDNKVFASSDGGKKYKEVASAKAGEQITGVRVIPNEGGFVVSVFGEADGLIRSYDIEGKNEQELAKVTGTAPTIIGAGEKMIAYSEGCINCDGARTAYKIYDLEKKTSKSFLTEAKPANVYEVHVNKDFTKIVYVSATTVTDPDEAGPGPGAAPYTVNIYDIKEDKTTKAATIGKAGEKNPNGTLKYRQLYLGFMAGTNTPYYAEGNVLYAVEGEKPSLLYESVNPIYGVYYVSKTSVIAATGKDGTDYTLSNYNLTDKKDTPIFQGDSNTVIFGITTK